MKINLVFLILFQFLLVMAKNLNLQDLYEQDLEEQEEEEYAFGEDLKKYRRLYINDMEIILNEDNDDIGLLKAYYRDDLYFECDIPEKISNGNFDWFVNGHFLGLNDSSYTLVYDKKIESNSTFLNISCYFQFTSNSKASGLNFPLIHLGFLFEIFCFYFGFLYYTHPLI